MKLILKNNLTKREVELTDIPVYSVNTVGYEIGIKLPSLDDGEYTYTLVNGTEIIGQGLLQIGEYSAPVSEYNNKSVVIQYNG